MISQQVNLYHPIFRKQEKRFSARAMVQAVLVVLAGIVLMYGYAWWQVGSLRSELARAERDRAAAAQRLEALNTRVAGRRADAVLEQERRDLELRLAAREQIQALLARETLGDQQGTSRYFAALARQSLSGLWLTGFTITGGGDSLTLTGRATRPELLPEYLDRLSGEQALAGKRFEVFQMQRPDRTTKSGASHPADYVEFTVKTTGEVTDSPPAGGRS